MILRVVAYFDGLVTSSTLFATLVGLVCHMLGYEVDTFGLILLGNLIYVSLTLSLGLWDKLLHIIEGDD